MFHTYIAPCLLILLLGRVASAAADPPPFVLLHALFDTETNLVAGSLTEFSVAVDGNIAVVGFPRESTGAASGVVRVYDASSGLLLHTLNKPTPSLPFPTFTAKGEFGHSVAVSGTRIVVGAWLDDTLPYYGGAAYVFDLASTNPIVPVLTLNNPSPAYSDRFGNSVAISGTKVVVGAYLDDSGATDAGSAYVYNLASANPRLPVLTLTNPVPASQDHFGSSVAVSGDWVVAGVPGSDVGASSAGLVHVFDLASATPALPAITLTNPNPTAPGFFGNSAAISGTRVVVGAIYDNTGAPGAGIAYVYDLAAATPATPVLTLTNPTPVTSDYFGASVGISGTRVVVGALWDDTGIANAGGAYVYDLTGATPGVPSSTLTNPAPFVAAGFGAAVAVGGTRVIAALSQINTTQVNAACAYLYDLGGAPPLVPAAAIPCSILAMNNRFGYSVAVSGTLMVVGANRDDTGEIDAGQAYVYDLGSATPAVPFLILTNPTPAVHDSFGYSVAISGKRVVVGAELDDAGATNAGAAYVYDLNGLMPGVPVLTLTNPSPQVEGRFGSAVAMTGNRVAIGAPFDNTGATNTGSAYVYDLAGATPAVPVLTLTNPAPVKYDLFGSSVAIESNRIVVGAYGQSDGVTFHGSAYVYDLAGATPALPVLTLHEPMLSPLASFGASVAISGSRVVVGAPWAIGGPSLGGAAYVFDLSRFEPALPVLTLTNPFRTVDGAFGVSVAISSTRVVIGNSISGSAYVHVIDSANPMQPVAILKKPSPVAGDRFGKAVAIDSGTIVVGDYNDNTTGGNRGAAYVFGAPAPTLGITRGPPGFGRLFWRPPSPLGFVLSYSDILPATNWVKASSGSLNPINIFTTNQARFYRLVLP